MARMSGIGVVLLLLCVAGNCYAEASEQFVDPMRPIGYQAPVVKKTTVEKQLRVNTNNWKLTAVLTSAGRSVAVINGESLQVGGSLDGYRLVQIDFDKVILKNKQRTLVLRRAGTGLKKRSTARDSRKGSKP